MVLVSINRSSRRKEVNNRESNQGQVLQYNKDYTIYYIGNTTRPLRI
ncbi:unnamed protein product [marine sediment metagenome]|uniref:Uncharacterized protein n=1 Tax=marine sediment metagenome TaxID=412755 RepID=X1ADY6_9ZZZZ